MGLLVAQGSPLMDGQAMDALQAPRFIGDVDGDRFDDRVQVGLGQWEYRVLEKAIIVRSIVVFYWCYR